MSLFMAMPGILSRHREVEYMELTKANCKEIPKQIKILSLSWVSNRGLSWDQFKANFDDSNISSVIIRSERDHIAWY